MSQCIKIYPCESTEYKRLNAAAKLLSAFTDKKFYADTTYFDIGQKWQWTTILLRDDNSICQFLSPLDQKIIVSGSYDEYMSCIKELIDKANRRKH